MKIWKILTKIILSLVAAFITFNLVGFIYALLTPKIDIKSANSFSVYDKNNNLVFKEMETILG